MGVGTDLEFQPGHGTTFLRFPFPVSSSPSLVSPIIGYNGIRCYIYINLDESLNYALTGALSEISLNTVNTISQMLQETEAIYKVYSALSTQEIPLQGFVTIYACFKT